MYFRVEEFGYYLTSQWIGRSKENLNKENEDTKKEFARSTKQVNELEEEKKILNKENEGSRM